MGAVQSAATVAETYTCSKCGRTKPIEEYRMVRSSYRLKSTGEKRVREYRLQHCNTCYRRQRRSYYRREREETKRRAREWATKNPDRVKSAQDKYNASERGKANRKRYEKSSKGKASQKRYKRRALLRNKVGIPVPVMQPFVARAARELGNAETVRGLTNIKDEGITRLAAITGIDNGTLYKISKGQGKQVTVEVADAICLHIDASLPELVERAREWAQLTGDSWPEGYRIT